MLHGIKNISYNDQGYIFWKGQQIEHCVQPEDPEWSKQIRELERRCKILEKRGAAINCNTVIQEWDELGNGDKWEIAFRSCTATEAAKQASKSICIAFGLDGINDPAYIASTIQIEMLLNSEKSEKVK